jgi:hypothetical protein
VTLKRKTSVGAIIALAVCALAVSLAGSGANVQAQQLTDFADFQNLDATQLESLQVKLTFVGTQEKTIPTVAFSATGTTVDMQEFMPFRRDGVVYTNDDFPDILRTFQASAAELQAVVDAVAEVPAATDGTTVQQEFLSFMMTSTNGDTIGFEAIMRPEDSRVLLDYIRTSLDPTNAGRDAIRVLSEELGLRRVRLDLAQGWNLVSLPEAPDSTEVARVLSSIRGSYAIVFAFDSSDPQAPWRRFVPDGDSDLNTLASLDEKTGFWVLMSQADTLAVSGTVDAATDIDLATGWNLLPYPSHTDRTVEEALTPIAGDLLIAYGHDASDPANPWRRYIPGDEALSNLTELAPGMASWLLMDAATTLTVAD